MNLSTRPYRQLSLVVVAVSVLALSEGAAQEEPTTSYNLTGGAVARGAEIRVPFSIESTEEVRAFTMSINFDEEVLAVTDVVVSHIVPEEFNDPPIYPDYLSPENWGFYTMRFNNTDEKPGDDTDEGVMKAAGVFSFNGYYALPVGEPTEVLDIGFRVKEGSSLGETQIRFEDFLHIEDTSPDVENLVAVNPDVDSVVPEYNTTPVLVNAVLAVVGEVSLFRRGDVNADDSIDLSDAVAALEMLFSGAALPACRDRVDMNDDGRLDVSDPVRLLGHLFLGEDPLPPPFESRGADPTADAIPCSVSST